MSEADEQKTAPDGTAFVGVPEDRFTEAYLWAMDHVGRRGRRDPVAAEDVHDAATSALLWARAHCTALSTWTNFARAAVKVATDRAISKRARRTRTRPAMMSLDARGVNNTDSDDDAPTFDAPAPADGQHTPKLIADLPEELAFVVRLYFVDAFDLRECGLLLGCSQNTVKRRLLQAAAMLAPNLAPQQRARKTKHLGRG